MKKPGPYTTGIGSLPHHNIDAALEYSFRHDVPFLPQIPIRNSWEYMIAQALDGLPGLQVEKDGGTFLDLAVWNGRANSFGEKLDDAFTRKDFAAFEPTGASSSGWQPFLWECQERGIAQAKVQLAGPITCQWALTLSDASNVQAHPSLSAQVFKLLTARALAMVLRLKECGVQPLLFLDEPALYAIDKKNPWHRMALNELGIMIDVLRKAGASVGLHCCSDADWASLLELKLNVISIDVDLSLSSFLKNKSELLSFLSGGGRLSFGVIPTARNKIVNADPLQYRRALLAAWTSFATATGQPDPKSWVKRLWEDSYLTPACGLALLTVGDAEMISDLLNRAAH